MRNIILTFKNSVLRNRAMIVLAVAAAAMMCFMFWGINNADGVMFASSVDKVCVGLIDPDGEMTENLTEYLCDTLGMEIAEEKDYDSLSSLLIDRKISAIIEVPAGSYAAAAGGSPKKLELTTLGDYENAAFIEAYLGSYMSGLSVISSAADGDEKMFSEMLSAQKPPSEVKISEMNTEIDSRTRANSAFRTAIGFMMMTVSIVTVFISKQIKDDRTLGTFDRMRVSSMKPIEYVLGVSVFGAICLTVMNLIYLAFVYSSANEPTVSAGLAFGASELFGLFSIGMATFFGMLISSSQALMTVSVGYSVIGSMIGGAWFPIDSDLGFISSLAKVFPQYWFMDIFSGLESAPAFNVLPNLCIIGLAAVLAYLVSAVIFTRKRS